MSNEKDFLIIRKSFEKVLHNLDMELKLRDSLKFEEYENKKFEFIISVDLNILFKELNQKELLKSKINENAKNWINFLYDFGFNIQLETYLNEEDSDEICEFLDKNCVLFDEIVYNKTIPFVRITKDNFVKFSNWKNAIKKVSEKLQDLSQEI